jgi:hypothetical protein
MCVGTLTPPGLFIYGKETSVPIHREKEIVITQNICIMVSILVK